LEGRYGFYQCFLDGDVDLEVLVGELGDRWEIADLRYKPYPCNYYTHAGVDAALALRERGLRAADVASLRLGVAAPMLHTMGEPIEVKRWPVDGYAAKFSGPYTVACALLGGRGLGLGLDDFRDQLVRDPARVALMARVEVEADQRCDAIFPEHAPAIVDAVTSDGMRWHEEVLTNRGSPQRPLRPDEVAAKFAANAGQTLPAEQVQVVRDAVSDLAGAAEVFTVGHALRAARRLR
jgi:2-methylcitrate dehydratase PrpD